MHDTHTKKLLDLLSRFKGGDTLYPIKVSTLQYLFGVFGDGGKVLIKTYASPKSFINRLIEPALKKICESPFAVNKIEILTATNGKIGYEVVDSLSSNEPRIRFLYRWLNQVSEKELEESSNIATELIVSVQRQTANGEEVPLADLIRLEKHLKIIGQEEAATKIKGRINERKAEEAIKRDLQAKEDAQGKISKIDEMLSQGFLDGI